MEVDKAAKQVSFGIAKDKDIEETAGTKTKAKGPFICPFCEQATPEDDVRNAGQAGYLSERLIGVIVQGKSGKDYRPVEEADLDPSAVIMYALDIDSLDMIDLIVLIEQNFEFKVEAQEMAGVKTLQDFYDYLTKRINQD